MQGITLLMMGTAGEIPQAPAEKTVFMEDMSDAQLASAVSVNYTVREGQCTLTESILIHS